MFQLLEPTTVTLLNVQTRVEKHGDEDTLAIDLAVVWNTNNRNLSAIHKQLRACLFCNLRDETADPQTEMDLPVDELPNVRIAGMDYPVKLDFQQVGARVEVAYGIDDTTAIVLQMSKMHKVQVTPIEGGSTEVKFAISSSTEIDDHIIGTLSVLQQREISIKLTMPDVEPAAEAPLTAADIFGDQGPAEKPLTAEDVFINKSSEPQASSVVVAIKGKGKKATAAA